MAAEGVRFAVAYAPTATTAPSHATLLTARDPLSHGVRRNGIALASASETIAEILSRHDYHTAGFVSSFVVNRKFGFDQGFELFDDDFSDPEAAARAPSSWKGAEIPGGVFRRAAAETTERAIEWIDRMRAESDRPLFLWVHYIDPHEPYRLPESLGDPFGSEGYPPHSLEQLVARYDALILLADRQLGRLVEHLERGGGADGALVVATADHGEAFLEHGWRSHGAQIYEESVRIPLIVRWRGRLAGGRVVTTPASLQDVVPTLLRLLAIREPDLDLQGADLAPLLRREAEDDGERPIFVQRQSYESDGTLEPIPLRDIGDRTYGGAVEVEGDKFAVRAGRWKYLEAPAESPARELYDLDADPGETRNLGAAHPELVQRLSGLIEGWRESVEGARDTPRRELSDADASALRELGYGRPR